jgi:dihydrofolate synthase/folylpolyglutamate synthase
MRFECLDDWLAWQESLNPKEIDLGLERVNHVLTRAGLSNSFDCPLITVAGTNGKGSVVAMLEAMAMAAGLKVCSYTSPHLFKYNERIKINSDPVDDVTLCEAFERIDQARADDALTYFEFGTLAAIDIFFRQQPDLVILEVGLGGRLDAVNIMQPDVSVLTSVAIDHIDWLGNDRESIGFEKAGIFRAAKPVICGDSEPPQSVLNVAEELHCELLLLGRDYRVISNSNAQSDDKNPGHNKPDNKLWTLQSCYGDIDELVQPCLTGEFQKLNAASAIMAMQVLQAKGQLSLLTANQQHQPLKPFIDSALSRINLSGRYQRIHHKPEVYVDVAHNPQAAQALAMQLRMNQTQGAAGEPYDKTWAIVAMLNDKDSRAVLESVSSEIDYWCFSGLEDVSRGMSAQSFVEKLPDSMIIEKNANLSEQSLHELSINQCTILNETALLANTVEKACELVLSKVKNKDRVIIFGSFYTVAKAMQYFSDLKDEPSELIN